MAAVAGVGEQALDGLSTSHCNAASDKWDAYQASSTFHASYADVSIPRAMASSMSAFDISMVKEQSPSRRRSRWRRTRSVLVLMRGSAALLVPVFISRATPVSNRAEMLLARTKGDIQGDILKTFIADNAAITIR